MRLKTILLYGFNSLSQISWGLLPNLRERVLRPLVFREVVLRVFLFGNGWYYFSVRSLGGRTIFGMLLIRHQYALQNKYLINRFRPDLRLPENTSINMDRANGSYPVKLHSGRTVFSVSFSEEDNGEAYPMMASLLFAVAAAFLFLMSFDALRKLGHARNQWG